MTKIVFAVELSNDGSPDNDRKYIRIPPPVSANPYYFRVVIPAGSDALNKGVLKTNYPINGDPFERHEFLSVE